MKRVLFVCIENSCRSQIAEGFARVYGQGMIEAYSAGSKPSGKINPDAIAVMKEIGIDISLQQSKGFSSLPVKEFDYVITLGCGDVCPFVPAKNHINWKVEDPKGKDRKFFRKTREQIESNLKALIEEMLAKGSR